MSSAEFVSIASDALRAVIHPLGAELWSITDTQGREYMTDADPVFWTSHAPLLFPIVGGLVDDTFRVDGQEYPMKRHGFARRNTFELVAHEAGEARFRLTDSAETRAVYPFAFVLEMVFRLEGSTLVMEATVSNPGPGDLPFSFGYHPAFAWPLPGGDGSDADKAAHKLVFAAEEPQSVRRVTPGTGLLLPDGEPSSVQGRELMLTEDLFTADAMIWTDLASRSLSYGAEGGAWLDVAFPDTGALGLWQVPGARYVCIEPWAGHSDPVGFAGDIREKPGMVILAPGASHRVRMDVTVREA